MGPKSVGKPIYGQETIVRAFEYFATSRSLYSMMRRDYQLPSITTLTRITSKVSKVSEIPFLSGVFKSIEGNQKLCMILHDEVYVKKMLLYHGGTLFGRSVDDPASLAKTILGIMVVCLYGGPKFLSKMLPVSGLKSQFLFEQIDATHQAIESSGGDVKAIISDGNRTNQSFFKLYKTIPNKPWLTENGTYLLFDFVHLLKNIRNNWLTEQMGELTFKDDGIVRIAKWGHLTKLYLLESRSSLKMSKLNEIAVAPKPIERQKVNTCLKVFCEETYNAILNHPGMKDQNDREDTAIFIKKVMTWWTIMNVKGKGVDIRHRNELEAVFTDPEDSRLKNVIEFGQMALEMKGPVKKRVKQLTRDTATAIHHTCNGIVNLIKHLLHTSHQYVCPGKFTTDPLEKAYSKLRQGSGGTYFISVQQVIEKHRINKASILLKLNVNIDAFNVESGHECSSCGYLMNEEEAYVFDSLPEMEDSIPVETKLSLVYIAGYVTRKDKELTEEQLLEQTTFYHQKFGSITDSLDRGGLNIPSDCACQWAFFSFIIFNVVKDKVCRKSLCSMLMAISEFYSFNMKNRHGHILANIFFKNFCLNATPRSGKEPQLKMLKLN